MVKMKDNYKAGDGKWFFTFSVGTLEGTSSYEIQMRYLEHPKINLLVHQNLKINPQNLYIKL